MSETILVTAPRGRNHDPNEVTVTIAGTEFGGWQDVRITRGVERMPSDFDLGVTERYPGQLTDLVIRPGQSAVVRIGNDRVITGWIDRYASSVNAESHQVRIIGRGRCEDLVDCSADVPQCQIGGTLPMALIGKLAAPFNIDVSALGTLPSVPAPQFNINLGETPWEIIDRITRWAQLLCYEDVYGNLVLAQIGAVKAASGFKQGVNVQSAALTLSADERFSVYTAMRMSTGKLADVGDDGNTIASVKDSTITRYRPRIIISEQTANGQPIALQRLNWELARRIGRSQAVQVVADSWRDEAGTLWTPNTLANVTLPILKLAATGWVIGDVTYTRGEEGTSCALTLMPTQAYQPEPNVLQATDYQVVDALPQGAGKP